MLDLSKELKDQNFATCEKYFNRMAPLGSWLEMEIGISGEEDGVDNTGVDNAQFYAQPEDIINVGKALHAIGPNFSIAAAFGRVHGVLQAWTCPFEARIVCYASGFYSETNWWEQSQATVRLMCTQS